MSDGASPLADDADAVLLRVGELLARLSAPTNELHAQGWSDGGAGAARSALEAFARKVRLLGSLPPPGERLNGMMRSLDWGWGDVRGELVDDLAKLENDLRHL